MAVPTKTQKNSLFNRRYFLFAHGPWICGVLSFLLTFSSTTGDEIPVFSLAVLLSLTGSILAMNGLRKFKDGSKILPAIGFASSLLTLMISSLALAVDVLLRNYTF